MSQAALLGSQVQLTTFSAKHVPKRSKRRTMYNMARLVENITQCTKSSCKR